MQTCYHENNVHTYAHIPAFKVNFFLFTAEGNYQDGLSEENEEH